MFNLGKSAFQVGYIPMIQFIGSRANLPKQPSGTSVKSPVQSYSSGSSIVIPSLRFPDLT